MINCEVCVHIKYVSKSVNSAGLLQKGMFSNTSTLILFRRLFGDFERNSHLAFFFFWYK